jgi:hypothetical protein
MVDSEPVQKPSHTSQNWMIRLPCRTLRRLVLAWVLKKINKFRTPPEVDSGHGQSSRAS